MAQGRRAERRQRKKERKRQEALIPGVPGMQDGGVNLPFAPEYGGFHDPYAPGGLYTDIGALATQLGIPPGPDAIYEIESLLGSGFLRDLLTGGGGGGGGGRAWLPGEFELEQQRQALEERAQRAHETRTRLDRQAQIAIATGDRAAQERIANEQAALDAAELEYARQRDDLDRQLAEQQGALDFNLATRGQDISTRGQDIGAQLDFLDLQLQQDAMLRNDALARGDQQLAIDIEQRMRTTQDAQNQLAVRGQDITQRGQDIDAALTTNAQQIDLFSAQIRQFEAEGNMAAAQDTENRLRAALRQQAALEQQGLELEAAGLGI